MRRVIRYINEGNSVRTPEELVRALQSHSGPKNTFTELLRIDKGRCDYLEKECAQYLKKSRIHFGRVNDISFVVGGDNRKLRYFEYSLIDGGACLTLPDFDSFCMISSAETGFPLTGALRSLPGIPTRKNEELCSSAKRREKVSRPR